MNSEVVKLLRDTANNFAQLADALEQEHEQTKTRIDYIEMQVCDARGTLKEAANLILSRL